MTNHKLESRMTECKLEAGVDEAGRGPLAGPVFAAAVILAEDFYHPLLNDSKQMTRKDMLIVRDEIEKNAIAWAVESMSAEIIDKENILRATFLAMNAAVRKLNVKPEMLIVDGNRFISLTGIPYRTCIHGDATYTSIAAASVLAKTYRDDYMIKLSSDYPAYGWDKNFGYPTKAHREAIHKYGLTPFHRKTFKVK